MVNVKNIYYMFSYVYQKLSHIGYGRIKVEQYDNIQNLMAEILSKAISTQLKEGLTKDYEEVELISGVPRGKVDFSSSIKHHTFSQHKVACKYGLYSENIIFNQILKTTLVKLITSKDVIDVQKKKLKKLMIYFGDVKQIDIQSIDWKTLGYYPNNQSYKLLMNICYLIIKGLLLTTDDGTQKLAQFIDENQMYKLFEKFVLCYFKKEFPNLSVSTNYIKWSTDDGYIEFLPTMKTDIVLEFEERFLIIDTKYYSKSMQTNRFNNKETMISNHLYQIFTYVKNMGADVNGKVSGMLLYAKTDAEVIPNNSYRLSGNKITIKSLDLNVDWEELSGQLNSIAECFINGTI